MNILFLLSYNYCSSSSMVQLLCYFTVTLDQIIALIHNGHHTMYVLKNKFVNSIVLNIVLKRYEKP